MSRIDSLVTEVKALLKNDDVDAVKAGLSLADEADTLLEDNPDRALRIRSHLLSQYAKLLVHGGQTDAGYRLFYALLAWDLSRDVWETNLDREPRDRHLGPCVDACPEFLPWVEALTDAPEPPPEAAPFTWEKPAKLDRRMVLISGCRHQALLSPGWTDTLAPGRRARMAMLAHWGASLNARYSSKDSTVVHHVAKLEDHATLRWLAAQGLDLDARDKKGETPLMWVADRKGSGPTLRLLVELGADVNAVSERGRTLLFDAAYSGDASTIAALVELGVDLDHAQSPGYTALEMAARSDNKATAKALLDAGATPTPEALKTAKESNYATMTRLIHAALEAHAPGSVEPLAGLDEVARRLGEQAARWADDSGEYAEYMAEGDDGGELIVEQYWEAHFEGQAREAVQAETGAETEDSQLLSTLASMKTTYREAFFASIA